MTKLVAVTYRIPVKLKNQIDRSAKDNMRSSNSEVAHLIAQGLDGSVDKDMHNKLDNIYHELLKQRKQ